MWWPSTTGLCGFYGGAFQYHIVQKSVSVEGASVLCAESTWRDQWPGRCGMAALGWSFLIIAVALVQAIGEVGAVCLLCFITQRDPIYKVAARRVCFVLIASMNAFVGLGQQRSASPGEIIIS